MTSVTWCHIDISWIFPIVILWKLRWGHIENGLDWIETRSESGHVFNTILDSEIVVKSWPDSNLVSIQSIQFSMWPYRNFHIAENFRLWSALPKDFFLEWKSDFRFILINKAGSPCKSRNSMTTLVTVDEVIPSHNSRPLHIREGYCFISFCLYITGS